MYTTIEGLDLARLQALLSADPEHPHIHIVDMPYRLTSIWQDCGCKLRIWEKGGEMAAWAVFQPACWSIIRFEKDLRQDLPLPQLPDGFSIRPLRGDSEVETYVQLHRAAFGSEMMTTAWRKRTLEHPAYRPALDLVAVDAQDKPVGFCVCWLWQGVGQIEPLGVHPDYRASGLGRALELAALQALRNAGARYMHIDHVSENKAAIALSLQTGFKQINNAVRYFVTTGA